MECQFAYWLFAGTGPTTIQLGLFGIGCLLAFDATRRWRTRHKAAVVVVTSEEQPEWAEEEYRRAA